MAHEFQIDIDRVRNIPAVPTILEVVCRATGMGFAAVARVTEDRWIACRVLDHIHFGLQPGGELKVETTLCHEVRKTRDIVAFDDAATDPVYAAHHTPKLYGLRSYISVPIVLGDGRFFGTLCAIDPGPAKVNNPQTIATFKLFAELIAQHIDAGERLIAAEADVKRARQEAEIREQFIAVLGHDLRSPLGAIDAGTGTLLREGWTERAPRILGLMKNSVARMAGLIDNVLDFARGRLGGGIELSRGGPVPLRDTLEQIVAEARLGNPDRRIAFETDLPRSVAVDRARIGQMLSNLLANAITHGARGTPIAVHAAVVQDVFELSVRNAGEPIPANVLPQLFQPFYRGNDGKKGLGLGLYIANEIARAHGGTLTVASDRSGTCFAFRMDVR